MSVSTRPYQPLGSSLGVPVVISVILVLVFHTAIILMGGSYKRVENVLLAISAFILVYLVAFAVIPIRLRRCMVHCCRFSYQVPTPTPYI